MMVEPGATVKEGDHLTSKSKPIVIAADAEGRVLLLPDRILVYNPQGRALRFRLTPDVVSLKGNGEPVREGEKLVKLAIPLTTILIEDIEDKDGISIVHFHPKSTVEINQAATVRPGDKVKQGDLLTKGVVAPHTLLETAGVQKAREYLLSEIHKVYKAQGVDINDKHLELIIREILNNVRIVDRGDSHFLLSDLVSLEEFQDEVRRLMRWNQEAEQTCNEAIGEKIAEDIVAQGRLIAAADDPLTEDVMAAAQRANLNLIRVRRGEEAVEIPLEKKRLPIGERELLRISKAALQTKGWLSAASFQRTTKVLAEAALRGEIDELDGLKPSIIVGKKIPAGTGFPDTPEVPLSETGEYSEREPELA
jgi:DNA-directed RNA polymerase subunit beta'